MKIVIEGDPLALTRHRSRIVYGRVYQYDPQKCVKRKVREKVLEQIGKVYDDEDKEKIVGMSKLYECKALKAVLTFHVPYLSKMTKAQENLASWGIIKPTSKPDIDNYIKFYLDCFNGVLYHDDSQIVAIESRKQYSYNPRVEIEIMSEDLEIDEEYFSDRQVLEVMAVSDMADLYQICAETSLSGREIAKAMRLIAERYALKLMKIKKLGLKDAIEKR